jgi:AcrR family transcriptional regulator
MESKEMREKLIEAAYREFGRTGPGFSLKGLVEKNRFSRATFYYYFESKEVLTAELLKYHRELAEVYLKDVRKEVKSIIPDLYEVMYRYKEGILFHQQLLKHKDIEDFYTLYRDLNDRSLVILLPLIKEQFETQKTDQELIEFYHTLTEIGLMIRKNYLVLSPFTFIENNPSVFFRISIARAVIFSTVRLSVCRRIYHVSVRV